MNLSDFKESHEAPEKEGGNENQDIPDEIRRELEARGITFDGNSSSERFSWLSTKKEGLRAPSKTFTLLEKEVGEVVLRAGGDGINAISVSIYNRGDDGHLNVRDYRTKLEEWRQLLDDKFKVRSQPRNGTGVVATTGFLWKVEGVAYLLEGSINKKQKRSEFIRLRIAPLKGFGKLEKKASRSEVENNVVKKENGDVYLKGIPMVDQGAKGYCVVASIERVALYYGIEVDQHELAQIANTSAAGGTSAEAMEKAFKQITGKIHVRTNRIMDYEYNQLVKDVKAYDREAKRQEARVFNIDFDRNYVIAEGFWANADKDVFKKVKAKQSRYKFFNSKIEEFIDRGIPVCWTLYLGMFPEEGLPQPWGGHMRLIIGYNKKTKELIYTDSWGEGHAEKRMPAIEAWCMTTGLYAMIPLN